MESTIPHNGPIVEPRGHSGPAAHHSVPYGRVFLILVGLTFVTVLVAIRRFPNELINVLLALFVASIKAICVARYFMHLKFEGKLIKAVLYVPLGLAIVLTISLIPDIGLGRETAFNDVVGWFERMVHAAVG